MNHNLKLRIITALVGVPLILFLVTSAGVEGVALFAWVISSAMLYEFSKMFFRLEDAQLKTFLLLAFNTLIHIAHYWFSIGVNSGFLGIAPVFFFFLIFLFMVPKVLHYGGESVLNSEAGVQRLRNHVAELMALCFGWIYLGWIPLLMVGIRQANYGKHWLILALLVVWAGDTFAYFAGKYCGKHMLFETVSPKKTWEGFFGGLIGGIVVAALYAHYYLPFESLITVIILAVVIGVAAALGDLCESLMKRATNMKDSGTILPGHGGFLDRFDGVLFAVPVMSAFLWMNI